MMKICFDNVKIVLTMKLSPYYRFIIIAGSGLFIGIMIAIYGLFPILNTIEAYVQKVIKYDKKADYYNLVDTLKKLAENDV